MPLLAPVGSGDSMDQTLSPPAEVTKLGQAGNVGSVGSADSDMDCNLHCDGLEAIPSSACDSHEGIVDQSPPLSTKVGMHSQVGNADFELERDLEKIIDEDLSKGLEA